MGSALADRDGHAVWSLSGRGILRALRTLGGSIKELTLESDIGDGPAPDGVVATGLMPSFHVIPGIWTPIEGYGGISKFLRRRQLGLIPDGGDGDAANLIEFAYDWRLSNRRTALALKERITAALERWRASTPERRQAKVVFVCHSMGGLVARWFIEKEGGAEMTKALVTLGTPHRGSLNALEQLVNGVHKGRWPFRIDLTAFARSLPSLYQLLPEYACIENSGDLSKTTEVDLPSLSKSMVDDGMAFHNALDSAELAYSVMPIVGIGQETRTTAQLDGEYIVPLTTIDGQDRGGDGTVPRLAARPRRMGETDTAIRGVGEGHGSLVVNKSVLDQLEFLLTAEDVTYRASSEPEEERLLGLTVPDLHMVGEPVLVGVRSPEAWVLEATALDESGQEVATELVRYRGRADESIGRRGEVVFTSLAPGGYTIVVRAPHDRTGVEVPPVRATTLVLEA
jgi:pimeloyl-ACP methyl ester carboxylesterase